MLDILTGLPVFTQNPADGGDQWVEMILHKNWKYWQERVTEY